MNPCQKTAGKSMLQVGDVLNEKWVILSFVEKGGMGEVYRAHQTNLNRDVAIKVISRDWLESVGRESDEAQASVHRFRREVQAMALIRHPNVIQVFDCDSLVKRKGDQEFSIEYIVMEYIPGGSLRDTMSETGFYPDEGEFKRWLRQYFLPVLVGVKALHEKGIVHRDLKPENILIDHHTPKIADFGLARSSKLKPVTQSVEIKGSPCYMSPEQFLDFRRTDQRTDIYSLGKILFEAVDGRIKSGVLPFKSAKLGRSDSPTFCELDRIIQMATAEDRSQRTKVVNNLIEQLQSLSGPHPGVKKPSHVRPRYTWMWAIILATILLGLPMVRLDLSGEPTWSPMNENSMTYDQVPNSERERRDLPIIEKAGQDDVSDDQNSASRPGNMLTVKSGRLDTVQIAPFTIDDSPVNNQQFVEFLNRSISQIGVESGVVKGGGANWYLLGEVYSGYEPIVFSNNEFHVDPAYALRPVLRVTAYGASAFANYLGRRLPTDVELLYASDRNTSLASAIPVNPYSEPTGVFSFFLDLVGLQQPQRGLSEWVQCKTGSDSRDLTKTHRYAIMNFNGSTNRGKTLRPVIVDRYPWEACEEVTFRTVKENGGNTPAG